jgi:PAS domain S-box-containing protein
MSEDLVSGAAPPKPRLLFVEDEATLREHLAERLSDDYLVDTAGNGNEALLAVMRARPALVVTDIVMPDMDGVELLKTLRQTSNTRSIPVLLISGRAAEDYRIEGFEEGADGFLAKPYTERELRALIGSMLRSARVRADAAGREAREHAEQRALIERATLLESITDAFYALDRQWRHTYVNRRALDYYGMERADLIGRSLLEVFPVLKDTVFESQFRRALREERSVSFESFAPHMERWLDVHAYPTPQGLAVNFRDISRRKNAEAELQRVLSDLRTREEQLRDSQLQLALEVDSMRRLYELVNRLLACDELQTALEEVLDAALVLMEAELGDVRLLDPATGESRIVAQRGLGGTDSGGIQSTPIMSRSGELLGVLSTHFSGPQRPSERALRMMDLYARQAAEFLEHMRAEAARRPPQV